MARSAEARHDRRRRLVSVSVVLVLLALGGYANATVKHRRAAADSSPITMTPSVMLSESASSSAWYCPGPLPIAVTGARAEIELANVSGRRVHGEVVIVTNRGASSTRAVSIKGGSMVRVPVATPATSSYAAASVLLDGVGVGVTEVEHGPSGPVTSSCVTSVAPNAYLSGGTTRLAGNIALALFDPGATPAVANVSFATNSGPVAPPAFQGVPINSGQLIVLNVGQDLPQQQNVATLVSSSGGRIVVGELDSNVISKARTLALANGIPSAGRSWYFAPTPSGGSAVGSFLVLNASKRATKVSLQLGSSLGPAVATAPIAPGAVEVLSAARDVAPGALRWAKLVSDNSARIVVERQTVIPSPINRVLTNKHGKAFVITSPLGLPDQLPVGIAESGGSPLLERTWLLGGGESDGSTGEIVSVANPTKKAVTIRIRALSGPPSAVAAIQHVGPIRLVAGSAAAIDLGRIVANASALAVVVQASDPVACGADLYAKGSKESVGFTVSAGIPVA